ncbi:hypothetical protein LCGC14_2057020 [marine sediment metagenome]|uniref:DUF6788 domain-containing protein n=1 Tax=marine sediment metagenome TaxID=412755 RepID=A0A0F9H0S3_9ZZZZ|nr:hypothetical protein [Porticoccus sp.]
MVYKIDRLKSKITSKERILKGSIAKQYKQCGRLNCRCREDRKYWHGPYWIWTRKEKGKTVTKTLNKNQAISVKNAIKEMKDLSLIIEKWKAQSLKEIEKMSE